MSEEEKQLVREHYEAVVVFLLQRGYTGQQLLEMGPEESCSIAALELSLIE